MEQQTYHHYVSMDLYGNGVAHDILLMKEDKEVGDVYFIKVEDLDDIDRARVRQILTRRNANTMPLWDVMSQVTLRNGMNALTYFNQLVKVRTASGQIINPSSVRRGVARVAPRKAPTTQETKADISDSGPVAKDGETPEPKKRGPGRPRQPKNKD